MRDHRSSVATLFVDHALVDGEAVPLARCADHIRALRLRVGNPVALTNGRGTIAHGTLDGSDRGGWRAVISRCEAVGRKSSPRLFAPVADRARLLWLAEKAAEVGIESWRLVDFSRSGSVAPRGGGSGFAEKVRARMIAALEQSGGAWLPHVESDATVEALASESGPNRLLLHPAGRPILSSLRGSAGACSITVGPEGGFEREELDRLTESGWTPVSLGSGILRFETAAVGALAIIRVAHDATEE